MHKSRKPILALAIALVGVSLLAADAQAIILVPGDEDILASGEAKPTGPFVVVKAGLPEPFKALTFSGTLTTTVISGDTSNALGGLTFLYQFTNDALSPNAIKRFTIQDFELALFGTDVSYQIPSGGLVVPTFQDRATADVVGYSFVGGPVGSGVVNPSATSAILVVQTNANFWKPIIANVIDGSTANPPSFGPTVPEPGTFALLGMGAVGLLLGAARRKLRR